QEADVDIEAVQADGESLTQSMFAEKFVVALCHGVVESVADPVALLRSLASVLRPRGVLSVQVPGLAAAMKHLVSLGDVALAGQLLAANVHEWDHAVLGPRRYDPAALTSLMEAAGFSMIGVRGVRVFSDSVPPDLTDDDALRFGALLELEQRLRVQPQFAAGSGGLQALGRLD
ncbi:MAG: methyltransferase domain-containing protein, partial [Actinomycetales bacterium]|nr:methyltransferase domain-containing protein [Actinomycetales bacterium]